MPATVSTPPATMRKRERFAQEHHADRHRHHRDEVGHDRGPGRADLGDEPVAQDVGDAGPEHAQQRDGQGAARIEVEPLARRVDQGQRQEQGGAGTSWPVAATTGGSVIRWRRA